MKVIIVSLMMMFGLSNQAMAKDELSVTPESVWTTLQAEADEVLFVDVRDPVEIMFIGGTDAVDINIPFKLVDRTQFNKDKGVFTLHDNPDFARDIEKALKAKGLGKDAPIVTMCRSGSERGKPSAEYLISQGFTNVKYVDHGFQGDTLKEGVIKGFRLSNGWQNTGLPWSPKLNADKMYKP